MPKLVLLNVAVVAGRYLEPVHLLLMVPVLTAEDAVERDDRTYVQVT